METPRRISREEAKALWNAIGPHMRWLKRLCDRMDQLGINSADPIYLAAYAAYNAAHSLAILSHYRSCEGGVGELPSE